jgi:hypothetical protein
MLQFYHKFDNYLKTIDYVLIIVLIMFIIYQLSIIKKINHLFNWIYYFE